MKTGLVLEGGGMRGIYTTGVLDWLLDQKYLPDYCIGVSAGACHATSYLSKQRGRSFRINTAYLQNVRQREEPAENRLYVRDGFYFR